MGGGPEHEGSLVGIDFHDEPLCFGLSDIRNRPLILAYNTVAEIAGLFLVAAVFIGAPFLVERI
jgi:hypothetical protein